MEDEYGIELSLGLPCGGSAGKSKAKDASSDNKTDEGGGNKLMGGNVNVADVSLKHLFHAGFEKHESIGPQRSESSLQPQENSCWTDLRKSSGQTCRGITHNSLGFKNYGVQITGRLTSMKRNPVSLRLEGRCGQRLLTSIRCHLCRKSREHIDLRPRVGVSASKSINLKMQKNQKKQEGESEHVNAHSKSHVGINLLKNSYVSVTTEDGSSAENEDVAESEAEGSTSRLVSQHDDSSKQYKGGVSDVPKDKRGIADSHVIDTQVQMTSNAAGKQGLN